MFPYVIATISAPRLKNAHVLQCLANQLGSCDTEAFNFLIASGIKQLDTLRGIGAQLQPLGLTTGYGDVLGNWCLKNIEEEQSALLQGGIPRKQGFTLEFVRYGDDLQNG